MISKQKKEKIKKKWGRCSKCGSREHLTIDHIVPKAIIEATGWVKPQDNYQVLCRNCNLRKGIRIASYRHDGNAKNAINQFRRKAKRADYILGKIDNKYAAEIRAIL